MQSRHAGHIIVEALQAGASEKKVVVRERDGARGRRFRLLARRRTATAPAQSRQSSLVISNLRLGCWLG